jgi:hypothetical protein
LFYKITSCQFSNSAVHGRPACPVPDPYPLSPAPADIKLGGAACLGRPHPIHRAHSHLPSFCQLLSADSSISSLARHGEGTVLRQGEREERAVVARGGCQAQGLHRGARHRRQLDRAAAEDRWYVHAAQDDDDASHLSILLCVFYY